MKHHKMDISQDWDSRTYVVTCDDCKKVILSTLVKFFVNPLRPEVGLLDLQEAGSELEGIHGVVCPSRDN